MKDQIRLNQLDGLRGICALIVAIYHFTGSTLFNGTPIPFSFIISQGDLFVDFFFVLSGFVISLNYAQSISTFLEFKNYLRKRFLRLYPLLLYTIIIYLAFELVFNVFLPHLLSSTQSVKSLLLQALDGLLFLNSTPLLGSTTGLNYPSWSISAEMIAYIVFGLTILFFKRFKVYALTAILILLGVFLISKNSYMETYSWGFARGLICFITGFYTYLFFKKYQHIRISSLWIYIISIVTIGVLYIRQYIEIKEIFTLLTIPFVFAILIFSFSLNKGHVAGVMSNKVFRWLGKTSYSIYLNHAIVLTLIQKGLFGFFKLPATTLNLYLALVLYLGLTLIYSQLTYIFIEKKGLRLFSRFKPLKVIPVNATGEPKKI